jgi:hypothetical protein
LVKEKLKKMEKPILEKRVVTLIENVQFDTSELEQRAIEVLGYHIDKPVKSKDVPKTWQKLLETMNEKHIQPFTTESVDRYMEYIPDPGAVHDTICSLFALGILLGIALALTLGWFFGWAISIGIFGALICLFGCGITVSMAENLRQSQPEPKKWYCHGLEKYKGNVPPIALQKALDIKENCARIKLWVVDTYGDTTNQDGIPQEAFLVAGTGKKHKVFVDGWDREKQLPYRWI